MTVRKVRLRKVPGLNGIMAEALCAIPGWIMSLCGACLRRNCFPAPWKKARVVVLLKSLEKLRSDPASYRSSLLSVLGKTFERIMVARIEEKVRAKMHDAQHGFREDRMMEIARVKEYMVGSESKYMLSLFVDFVGAFDNLE